MDQRAAFWRLREALADVQRYEGASIKHDISIPLHEIPNFISRANDMIESMVPGGRTLAFGHLGDGNVHYNISQPIGMDKEAFLSRSHLVNDAVHAIVVELSGTIAAEHGVGRFKRDKILTIKDDVEIDLMKKLKNAFDPNHIMNIGSKI